MRQFTKKMHFVGVGGAGMSPLAEVLHSRGHIITGSDRERSSSTERLEKLGIRIQYGHEPGLVKDADLLVYSSAVKEDNPERLYAVEHGIPCLRRAEVLGDIMRTNFTICISGTHGKTTTTSLVGTIFMDALSSPTVLVGGMLRSAGSHAVVGNGRVLIAEADEYDRSFLAMYPSIAVITNIEADHLDCYKDLADIKETFIRFTERVPFDGAVIVCLDDEGILDVLPKIRRTVITYGISESADYQARNMVFTNGRATFDVYNRGKLLGGVSLSIPGIHNVRNSLAAIVSALETGIDFQTAARSISGFSGVKRRFEIVGEVNGVTVIDDYAHHPGEIKATLEAARRCGYGKITAVFQPHLYSRTRDFLNEFAEALSLADQVFITEIYKSREQPIPGVNAENIVNAMKNSGFSDVHFIGDKNEIVFALDNLVHSGDAVVFMGAGDIWETAYQYSKEKVNG